jgi:hypothetical protein
MEGSVVVRARRPASRAHTTNDPRRLAPDVDKRTHAGRMFADFYESVERDFPGADPAKVRDVALLKYEMERARTAGTLTLEDIVRVSHLIDRREQVLRLALRQRAVAQQSSDGGMRSTLAGRYGGKSGGAP